MHVHVVYICRLLYKYRNQLSLPTFVCRAIQTQAWQPKAQNLPRLTAYLSALYLILSMVDICGAPYLLGQGQLDPRSTKNMQHYVQLISRMVHNLFISQSHNISCWYTTLFIIILLNIRLFFINTNCEKLPIQKTMMQYFRLNVRRCIGLPELNTQFGVK